MSFIKLHRQLWLKFILAFFWLGTMTNPISAAPTTIRFESSLGEFKVNVFDKGEDIYVDVLKVAGCMGADTRVSNGIHVMQFKSGIMKINPVTDILSTRPNGQKDWRHIRLRDRAEIREGRLYISLRTVPMVFEQSFTYHLQKKLLTVGLPHKPTETPGFKAVSIRTVQRDQKIWISVEDLARTLGVVVYTYQVGGYSLMFPDFTIVELMVGSQTVFKRKQPYKRLADPVLAFGGIPYIPMDAVNTVFEVDVRWDSVSRMVLVPSNYGLFRDLKVVDLPKLYVIGYRPEPLEIFVEDMAAYYQEPDPTYLSSFDQPFESVRDVMNNLPIEKKYDGMDQLNGSFVGGFKGSIFSTPIEAHGSFQKLGPISKLVDGNVQWGFPVFQLSGGREYLTFNGLLNQYELIDQAAVSHSNDYYGDNPSNFNWHAKALYGQHNFELYASSQLFSQSMMYHQQMGMASLGFNWKMSRRQNLSFRLDDYEFKNDPKNITSAYLDPDLLELLKILYGEEYDPTTDATLIEGIMDMMISDRHNTGMADLNYTFKNIIDLTGSAGVSHYKDASQQDKPTTAADWKVRAILGGRSRRIESSYERVGDQYRSVGNPFSYQGKDVFRLVPHLEITKKWRLFGEYRRDEVHERADQGLPPYSTVYFSGVSSLNLKHNVIRASAYEYDSSLYGKRWTGSLDLTQYIGPHSIDMGGGGALQYDMFGTLFKRSYTGKASFTWTQKNKKFSLGEEFTQHTYLTLQNRHRYESQSNLLLQLGKFRTLLQYQFEPVSLTEESKLYTGHVRMGYQVLEKKYVSLFYAVAGPRTLLSQPYVWRAGIEFSVNMF